MLNKKTMEVNIIILCPMNFNNSFSQRINYNLSKNYVIFFPYFIAFSMFSYNRNAKASL